MISYTIEFHAEVAVDFNDAYVWYERQSNGLGDKFILAVRAKVEQIIMSPSTYGIKHKKGYRECKIDIFPYLIVYKIYRQKKVIFVSAIYHEKRHPQAKYRK